MRFSIPIRLLSLPNIRLHWRRLASLKKQQRYATWVCLTAARRQQVLPALPVIVTLTRVGPRRLDGDNLQAAFKYIRDQIAEALGADDGSLLYEWRYAQRRGPRKHYSVEVEIQTREP